MVIPLGLIIHVLYYVLVVLVVSNVLLAYFPDWRYHPLGELAFRLSEPILTPFRRLIPPIQTVRGGLDISPAVCLTLGWLITELLTWLLAMGLRR